MISKAKKHIIRIGLIALSLCFANNVTAQLIIDQSMTPEELVRTVLLGSGVTVSNIVFTGNAANAICAFSDGSTTNLGINEGVILSTGLAAEAANGAGVQASTGNGVPGDPDLNNIPGVIGTNDAATLEFDFIPQSDTLTFRYVFGSEEYPEFVNQFNDVFAFFISGPNPAGGSYTSENIALIPGTTDPVSINNVNNGPTNSGPCINCAFYVDNTGGTTIVYDGFTTVLEALAIVTPCSTYHMKLTIADDIDDVWDSGVFLEANSFSATGLMISADFSSSSVGYGSLIEGCNDATIYFELVEALTDPYVVHFDYLGTAINGIDYNLLPDSIVIPAGSLIDSLNIIPVQNDMIDPTRTLLIAFDYLSSCDMEEDTMSFLLLDNTIELSGLDTLYCSSDPPPLLTLYPPTGVLTGPGTFGNQFFPGSANSGINIIQFTNYFIDTTVRPWDTVCVNQVIDTTYVQAIPICDAGSDETTCQGSPFDFNSSVTIPWAFSFDSLRWSGGIGTFSDPGILHPIYYPDPSEIGDITLTLTAYGIATCGDAVSNMTLTIFAVPYASISAVPADTSCINDTVFFSGSAVSAVDTWVWDFGDGNTGNGQNLFNLYAAPGTYQVSLITTNLDGCSDTTYFDKIISDPFIDFSMSPNPACIGDTVWFTGLGDAVTYASWDWDFGDGNTGTGKNIWHIYASSGIHSVTLDVCSKSLVIDLEIIPQAIADAGSDEAICESIPFDFSTATIPASASDFTSLQWTTTGTGTFDNANTLHPIYTPPPGEFGTFTFTLSAFAISPCSDSISTMQLSIFDGPEAAYSVTPIDSICVGEQISFNATSTTTIVNWQWDFDDGFFGSGQNVPHTFASAGLYNVALVVTNSDMCTDTVIHTVTVFELPVANFNVFPGLGICRTEEFSFMGNSSTTIERWYWDLGDGTTATTQNVNHTYFLAGVYDVTLYVYNENSCRDTITQQVEVFELPICDFTISPNDTSCVGEVVAFNGSGTPDIVNWDWDFGDGNTSAGQFATNTYLLPNTYDVRLIVTNANGCQDTMTYQRVVVQPVIDFSMNLSPTCEGFIVDFTGIGAYDFTNYVWDFGDGGNAIGKNTTHIYTTPNTYTVTLTFCTSQIQHDILVNPAPSVFAGQDTISCEDVPFDLSTLPFPPTASNYSSLLWSGGLGTFDDPTALAPVYTPAPGELGFVTLTLTTSGIAPCADAASSMTIEVIEGAYAFAGSDEEHCQDEPFDFANSAQVPAAYNEIFRMWTHDGTGTIPDPTLEVPTYIPAPGETGIINFTFVASNIINCDSVDYMALTIHPTFFEVHQDSICFGDSLLLPGGTWVYGTGTYYDTLSSVFACDSVIESNVYEWPQIDADYLIGPRDSACIDEDVFFTRTGLSSLIDWMWDFDDGSFSTDLNPIHAFSSPGIFDVMFTFTDIEGCQDTVIHQVYVFQHPDVDFGTSASSACLNSAISFFGQSSDAISLWQWDFGDGSFGTGQNTSHVYTDYGAMAVTLTVTADNGCESSLTRLIFVAAPPTADFTYNIDKCDTIQFTDLSSAPPGYFLVEWLWDFGDGTTSDLQHPSHVFPAGGLYDVSLLITSDSSGLLCYDSITHQVLVPDRPTVYFTWSPEPTCLGEVTNFFGAAGVTIQQWYWDFDDGNFATAQDPDHTFAAAGIYNVMLMVTDNNGCWDTISHDVTVAAIPDVAFTVDPNPSCAGAQTSFSGSSSAVINTWLWDFGDGGSSIEQNPLHVFTSPGTYLVTLYAGDTNDCFNQTSQTVVVNPMPLANFIHNAPACSNDTVFFYNQSVSPNGAISQWIWDFGDGNSTTVNAPDDPDVFHLYASGGTYDVTLTVVDQDSCSNAITKQISVTARAHS